MGLNSFYNSGSDAELLKSLDGDSVHADQEELAKAMNKAGLVQKEVQVKGKNGQVFTRKQWVKASDNSSKPTGTNVINKENGTVNHTDSAGNDFKTYTDDQSGTVNMVGKFKSNSKVKLIEGMQKKGYEIDKEHTGKLPDGNEQISFKKNTQKSKQGDSAKTNVKFTPSSFGFRSGGQNVADMMNELHEGIGVTSISNGQVGYGTAKLDNGESVGFMLDENSKPHLIWQGKKFSAKELVDKWGGKKSQSTTQENKTDTDSKDSVQGKTGEYNGIKYKIHTNNPFDKLNNKYNYSVAEGQIKTYGFCIEDETHKGKNPLAQCVDNDTDVDGIVAEVTEKKSGKQNDSKPTQSESSNTKLSKEDAKKKTQSITSSIGKDSKARNDFMNKAKVQGITWKENDNAGINWMRCCMSMNKHFENGGSWSEDKGVQSNTPTQNNPKSITGKSGRPYSVWIEGSHIKGSVPGKEDSRNARDITDFTSQGFSSVEEVEDYVRKYF